MKRWFTTFALVSFLAFAGLTSAMAQATGVDTASCSTYLEATSSAQQAPYLAYERGYANANSPDPRYTESDAAQADENARVHTYCTENTKSSYAEAVAAVHGLTFKNAAIAGVTKDAATTSCKVGPLQACGGCSVTCGGGKQATCYNGINNSKNTWCVTKASCSCR